MTRHPNGIAVIIESVECRHFRNKLYGKIAGKYLATAENGKFNFAPRNYTYSFTGDVNERLFVLPYCATAAEALSSGAMVLQGNTGGNQFSGIWVGYDEGRIGQSNCVWVKVNNQDVLTNSAFLTQNLGVFMQEPSRHDDASITPPIPPIVTTEHPIFVQKTTLLPSDPNMSIEWFQGNKNNKSRQALHVGNMSNGPLLLDADGQYSGTFHIISFSTGDTGKMLTITAQSRGEIFWIELWRGMYDGQDVNAWLKIRRNIKSSTKHSNPTLTWRIEPGDYTIYFVTLDKNRQIANFEISYTVEIN